MTPAQPALVQAAGVGELTFDRDRWHVAATVIVGGSHRARDIPGADAAAAGGSAEWLIAVVCDGAGSAANGDVGARLASSRIVDNLMMALGASTPAPGTEEDIAQLRTTIDQAIETTRDSIVAYAEEQQLSVGSFASTLVGVACRDGAGLFFHLGDGLAIAFDADAQALVTSSGSEAEQQYSNETYFLTDKTWRDYLTFQPFTAMRSLCLMTDGVSPFAREAGALKSAFLEPVARYAATHDTTTTASAFTRLLDGEEARRFIEDDKTLQWATLDAGC
jgi:serine/threonine protein phosphatase PrpC